MSFPDTDDINEAAKLKAADIVNTEIINDRTLEAVVARAFIEGALWKVERMYVHGVTVNPPDPKLAARYAATKVKS